jgi:hypothetical protein
MSRTKGLSFAVGVKDCQKKMGVDIPQLLAYIARSIKPQGGDDDRQQTRFVSA